MSEFLTGSVFFGSFLSLFAFVIGLKCKARWKHPLANPMLIAIVLTLAVLLIFDIDYDSYYAGAKYISYFLTPATVCLAIPLYEQFELLRKNALAILAGITAGVMTSLLTVLLLSVLFSFSHTEYVTFLPKSITTAIGMGVAEKLGGYVPITVAVIIITGVFGNMFAEHLCRLFRITEPVAVGVAIGSSSHAIGTAKALELGELQGAISSLCIAVSGLLTVFASVLFANFY